MANVWQGALKVENYTKRRLTLPYGLAVLMSVVLFLLTLGAHDHFHQTCGYSGLALGLYQGLDLVDECQINYF